VGLGGQHRHEGVHHRGVAKHNTRGCHHHDLDDTSTVGTSNFIITIASANIVTRTCSWEQYSENPDVPERGDKCFACFRLSAKLWCVRALGCGA
jgi:hypothetical protein